MNSELLLPVGNIQMAQAAIHNGANAIYVGMPGFNARGRTHDHNFDELKEIIELCHLYNVHVHVAFNILIFQNELERAMMTLKEVLKLNPDALIIQDLGIVNLVRKLAPKQVIHGSTQMTITNHEAIELLDDLNIERFVLGRENSLSEIKIIKENTNKELEVFVHGALCVAYSGQCFTSEAIGGRSANRGQCAQSCRLEYDLIVDDKKVDLLDTKYLVSPQDLCGIQDIPKLVDLGIESFKVEGRLKSPEFVATVAHSYREAIDNFDLKRVSESKQRMALAYSRGFYNGWLDGVNHQKLVDGTYSSNRGLFVGKVLRVTGSSVLVESSSEILPGDGILIVKGDKKLGANVYEVTKNNKGYILRFQNSVDLKVLEPDFKVFINSREKLYKEVKKSFTDKQKLKRLPIHLKIIAKLGETLKVEASEGDCNISVESNIKLEAANKSSLSEEGIIEVLSGLSHSAYFIDSFSSIIDEGLFIPNKELKLLKQEMVRCLNEKRLRRESVLVGEYSHPLKIENVNANTNEKQSQLSLLVRTFSQLEGIVSYLKLNPNTKEMVKNIILDYEFGKDFIPSVKILKEEKIESVIATTRILKPNEYHNFTLLKRANPDGILIRNLGALNYFQNSDYKLYGDFSLNITNSFSFDYLLSKGLDSICVSYDMNNEQLLDLLEYVDTSKVEITAHQYMPEFHMEHCVFAAFLSSGSSFRDCGKPCEKHKVQLNDMYGNMHELKADQECRNTMFNSKSMSAASLIPVWQNKGVNHFRFEALHETADELMTKLALYFDLMGKKLTAEEVVAKIGHIESYGVSTGQLLKTTKYKDRKKNVRI